jgi:hypothetical protein
MYQQNATPEFIIFFRKILQTAHWGGFSPVHYNALFILLQYMFTIILLQSLLVYIPCLYLLLITPLLLYYIITSTRRYTTVMDQITIKTPNP